MERPSEIRSERLRMRRVRADDLDAIHAIMSDPETMRYWSSPPHATRDQTAAWLQSMIAADELGHSDEFVIEHLGVVVGKVGMWRPPEIGLFLHRDCWRRGLATEAMLRFLEHAGSTGIAYLTADVDPRNAACLRLLERSGFAETGRASATYVVAGRPCDSVYLRRELRLPTQGGTNQ